MIRRGFVYPVVALLCGLTPPAASAQWAASPGETVRDAFGPVTGGRVRTCRGACGVGCPSACSERTHYECIEGDRLRRVRAFSCGTHQGCREHDDCLDRCSQRHGAGFDCDAECHREAVARYGIEPAVSWAAAGGPFDGPPITFEYTRDAPDSPAPEFRCPDGARLDCAGAEARCLAGSESLTPVFDSYSSDNSQAMRISGFRAGLLCGGRVCEPAVDIQVTGEDSCDRGAGATPCTRYGVEFDYRNADPSLPLECSTSTTGGENDFIGGLIKRGFEAAPELDEKTFEGNPGLGQLLGALQKVVQSADSPEDLEVSMAPLGPDGRPIESQRVGSQRPSGPPPVPKTVDLPGASGHLVVPMYELADQIGDRQERVREVRCEHRGEPVLEATFRLRH